MNTIKPLFFLSIAVFLSSICAGQQARAQAKKPNVLFILVDDYGWRDIHAYGSDFYETPNMDKLIGESLKFTQAYATYPRCVPSRYSIMTGSHPARIGNNGRTKPGFTVSTPNISIGQAMKNAGYQTFYIGKWHLGDGQYAPSKVGFDYNIASGNAGATTSHFAPYNQFINGEATTRALLIPDLDDAPKGENLEDRLTAETIKQLQKDANKDKPFFGILAHYAVHAPLQGKPEYVKYFQEKLKKNPPPAGPDYEQAGPGKNKLKQDNAVYAAMIKNLDDNIGKIIKTLDDLGISKNTIVIVTSDHGGLSSSGNNRGLATSNRPLRAGKGNLYEGGVRVPLFIKWPGVIKGGTQTNSIVQGLDNFPTIVDMAGGKIPQQQLMDGKSYIDVIKEGKTHTNRTIFWHNPAPSPTSTADIYSSAIRSGDYKLVDLFADGKKDLYNLKNDIGEHQNIAAQHPDIVNKLYAELDAWRKKIGADMELRPQHLSASQRAARSIPEPAGDKKKARKTTDE